jgi:hypothetical protein
MTFRTQMHTKKFGKKCFRNLQGTMSHRPLTNTSSLKIAAAYCTTCNIWRGEPIRTTGETLWYSRYVQYNPLRTANPVWFINSRKSFSIESIPICNYMFLNRIITFCSNGFCWAGSSNALQKHIFPNRIIKVQLEYYNSFPNYKLFPVLKTFWKKKNTILRF